MMAPGQILRITWKSRSLEIRARLEIGPTNSQLNNINIEDRLTHSRCYYKVIKYLNLFETLPADCTYCWEL